MNRYSFLTLLFILLLSSCTSQMEYRDAEVSAVGHLYEPLDGKNLTLLSSASASLYFEWEAAKAEDGGAPLYELLFFRSDKAEEAPFYAMVSDNNGSFNHATVSHKALNRVLGLAGIKGGASGDIYWSVRSSRGLNSEQSALRHKLTLTSILGFDEIPGRLFISGEALAASEGGVREFSSSESGVFEVFVQLAGSKPFRLYDTADGAGRTFGLSGGHVVESSDPSTLEHEGIYRMTLDFNTASLKMVEIKDMGFFFSPGNKVTLDMPYIGKGMFRGEGIIAFHQESWGRDQRYKFLMTYADGTKQMWGTVHTTDVAPGPAKADDPYFHMVEKSMNQWDDKWKLNNEYDGAKEGYNPGAVTRITAIFAGEHYTHHVELVK